MRTDIVIPAGLVASVQLPALSVTTGGTDVRWVAFPTGRRRPRLRLPLDPRSAFRARWYLRVEFWSAAARMVVLISFTFVSAFHPAAIPRPISLTLWDVLFVWHLLAYIGKLPKQAPYRTATGDLRVPDVPIDLAKQWVELNPGVLPTIEPEPQPPRRPRRWYASWSAGLVIAAVVLFAAFPSAFLLSVILLLAGVVVGLGALPPGYIRFGDDDGA